MLKRTRITAALLIVAPIVGHAQTKSADQQELMQYRLTLPTLRKVEAAAQAMAKAAQNDPRFTAHAQAKQELETLRKKEEPTEADEKRMEALEKQLESEPLDSKEAGKNDDSLTEMAARLDREPIIAAALQSAGLTSREFMKFELMLLQASLAYRMQKVGTVKTLPAEIPAENVKFVADNEAELQRVMQQFQTMSK